MSDTFQASSAASPTPSAPGQVAPPAAERVYGPAPEAGPVPQAYQPVAGSQGPVTQGQPQVQPQPQQSLANPVPQQAPPQTPPAASPSGPDYEARIRQIEADRSREQQELSGYRSTVAQIQQYAEQQQRTNQTNQQIQMMLAQAESMPQAEANTFLRNQMVNIIGQERIAGQQQIQQREQAFQQQLKTVAAPQYADHLAQTMGLSQDARNELVALGDPDLMFRMAPQIKSRYDRLNQQIQQFQGGQQQIARSQEVAAMSQAGLGSFGGQSGISSFQIEVSDDPDVRAMQVLHALRNGPPQ